MLRATDRKGIRTRRKLHFWRRRNTDLTKPRLCVFRSTKHIQVQLIDDLSRTVICSASSMEKEMRGVKANGIQMAEKIGALVAERATKKGVKEVVFDRNGFQYHGRVMKLADAARAAGLQF